MDNNVDNIDGIEHLNDALPIAQQDIEDAANPLHQFQRNIILQPDVAGEALALQHNAEEVVVNEVYNVQVNAIGVPEENDAEVIIQPDVAGVAHPIIQPDVAGVAHPIIHLDVPGVAPPHDAVVAPPLQHFPADQTWYHYMENTTYDDIMDPTYEAENKKFSCVILGMKPNENKHLSVYKQNRAQGGVVNNPLPTYDRMFLLGSTNSLVGSCFVFIAQKKSDTKAFLKHFTGSDTIVGKTGYILEPFYEHKHLTISNHLPLIDVQFSFEPATIPRQVVRFNMETLQIQDTKMFFISGVRVLFQNSSVEFGGCGGVQCDRLIHTGKSNKCGCLINDTAPRFTISAKITVHDMETNEELFRNAQYRSWTLTKLFMIPSNDAIAAQYEQQHLLPFRNSVRENARFVNANGGWDICGWARKGAVVDAADDNVGLNKTTIEEIGSDTVAPHIITMVPHNQTINFIEELLNRRYRVN
jgi:hypothetical protein